MFGNKILSEWEAEWKTIQMAKKWEEKHIEVTERMEAWNSNTSLAVRSFRMAGKQTTKNDTNRRREKKWTQTK